jgi:GTP cyclohydrolase I
MRNASLTDSTSAHLAPGEEKPILTDAGAEDAFRSILRWIGEDPDRDGLHETPRRLVRAFREYFCGYEEDPDELEKDLRGSRRL